MKNILVLTPLLLLAAAVGCGETTSSTGGAGGTAGAGGSGAGGVGGTGGGTGPKGNCHSSVPDLLSEWDLFADIRNQVPAEDMVPFEVTSPLFTDYALKHRFVTIRGNEGAKIQFDNEARWQSPVGTIYTKTFAYPADQLTCGDDCREQLVETRLLVHVAAEDDRFGCEGGDSCWQVHVYVYDEEMTDAICTSGGAVVPVTYTAKECSLSGDRCESADDCVGIAETCVEVQAAVPEYFVPDNGTCTDCHGTPPDGRTLGPSTGMLNRGNAYGGTVVDDQIDALVAANLLSAPDVAEEDRTTFDDTNTWKDCGDDNLCIHDMARSYFDSNCAHCHASDGVEEKTGLWLDYFNMDPQIGDPTLPSDTDFTSWGVCKTPTSAGNVGNCPPGAINDIVPGNPDYSILLCRVNSVKPGEMMATVGRTEVHDEGLELLRRWVEILPDLFPDITRCPPIIPSE